MRLTIGELVAQTAHQSRELCDGSFAEEGDTSDRGSICLVKSASASSGHR